MVGVVKAFSGAGSADETANDTGGNPPLGSWKDGKFGFHSPQAETQWRQYALHSGVHFRNWNQGRKLNEKARQLVELGFAPSADIYRGPDGDYYQMTPAAREDPQISALRGAALKRDPGKVDIGTVISRANARIARQAMAVMAQQAPIVGAVPAGTIPEEVAPTNDNRAAANDNTINKGAVADAPDDDDPPASKRPGPGSRFGAAFEKGAMDGTILGELAQELKKGTGYDPDTLATRIPDRFMLSPASQQAWRDMYSPLGIAGGKRKIDLVSPEERKLYETDWERLTPEQQAAYRKMSDAAKARYAAWKQGYDSRTTMPPPQSVVERGVDFLGSTLGGLSSPENLVGLGEGEAAGRAGLKAIAPLTGKAVKAGEDVAAVIGPVFSRDGSALAETQTGSALGASQLLERPGSIAPAPKDWAKILSDAQFNVYTEKAARALKGERRGLIYVEEARPHLEEAHQFQLGSDGVKYNVETKKYSVPAMRYDNPNPKGVHHVKLDSAFVSKDRPTLVLNDAKRKLGIFSPPAREKTWNTLRRVRDAMQQNPEFDVVYEFPDEKAAKAARKFLHDKMIPNIQIVVRKTNDRP